jgi:hypothetical protein
MQSTPALDEIVLFELPSNEHAEQLLLDALSDRVAWLRCGDEASIASVLLAADELDLARLLRRVQYWLETSGLLALRFEVDGRMYVLEALLPALAYG